MSDGDVLSFIDKDTFPARRLTVADRVRLVPGGSSIREGAYVAPSVICMPPMFINVGAYVDEGSMIDSHALVGSCAQIGKRVHLSAAAQSWRRDSNPSTPLPSSSKTTCSSAAIAESTKARWSAYPRGA
jgi:tetrahydrodipicolinate N-succinyltransferase